jgi:cell division septum initiation protein DivIVA
MDNNLYNPSVWLDQKRHCLLYLRETPLTVEFVQHVDRQVALLRLDRNTFYRDCKLDSTVSVSSFVDTLLGTARNGCVISPAARFALTQVNSSTNHKEGTMPAKVATKPPSAKAAPKKVAAQEPLPFDTAKVVATGKSLDPKASNVDPDNGVHPVPGGTVKTVPVAPAKAAPAPAAKVSAPSLAKKAVTLEEAINAPDAQPETEAEPCKAATPDRAEPDFLAQAQQIVAEATAQAAQMVQEAKDLLEVAVKKTEEKRALDDARADAKKILDKAKAEVAKIRAAVAKLGGKKPRGKAKAEGEKAARGTRSVYDVEDFKGRTIKQLAEPVVRGDSARGALTVAIYNCTTTDEAMEYKGASPSFIMKMVEKGIIELS